MEEHNCIVSNNCYGLNYYKQKQIPYNTPFIGLFIYPDCFIRLLENFDMYMGMELSNCVFSKYGKTNYPVGNLGKDIEIHFLHYKTFKEASGKWIRRKTRMIHFKDCLVKMCDRDGFQIDHAKRFLALPLEKKILFVAKKNNFFPHDKNIVEIKEEEGEQHCPTGTQLELRYPVHRLQLLCNNSRNNINTL